MNEVKITVPNGYEIDKENSTFECIKFKPIKRNIKVWEDLTHISGIYIRSDSGIGAGEWTNRANNQNVFVTEKQAKSALAMSQISQLIPYYGGEITDEEWKDAIQVKHCIKRDSGDIEIRNYYTAWFFLAFHTNQQAIDFLENNRQLVEDYYML